MNEKNETSISIEETDKDRLFIFYNEIFLHSARVATMAAKIAEKLNYRETNVNKLFLAGMWHDIGKFLIMDVVCKNDLSEAQMNLLNKHSAFSFNILMQSQNYIAPDILGLVLFHHSHPDGTGHPHIDGPVTEKIQIISASDIVDAMTHERHYRNGKTNDKSDAINYLRECKYEERILSAIEEINIKDEDLPDFFPPANIKIKYTKESGLDIKIDSKISSDYLGEGVYE